MRFMVIVKASEDSERGVMPTEQELAEMGAYNEELVRAGVMLAGEGLHPSSRGARVRFAADGSSTVVDGPFAETKELVAGFWILQVSSREEVLEWVKKAPFRDGEVEVRQVFESDDFGDAMTPELREQEDRMRATVAERQGS
ncbi:YciI family protein [Modestobacter marinus]|uniref:YciI family protein n=1 Tax=Modestobacter marinus TaxID=477641 RepID=UPI001C972223|nr:YciI family protein [Modestobacter marinus]